MFALFNAAVFVSAFLLFLIQPMSANILLPKVGGSPNIWNACTVFFQTALLIGYAYSYFISEKLSVRKQIPIHACVLICGIFLMSSDLGALNISTSSPVSGVLTGLLQSIAVPFILLSATSPLLQRWLSLSVSKHSATPYSLYVSSNIGSLLSLLLYPAVIEHFLTFSDQGRIWHYSYAAFAALICVLGFCLSGKLSEDADKTAEKDASPVEKIPFARAGSWILFAFIPSSLMLGVTNHVSVDIGGLPFLWVIPLSLYLLSFILTFSGLYTEKVEKIFRFSAKIGIFIVPYLFFTQNFTSSFAHNLFLIAVHCVLYFIFAVYCHGLLARKKPSASALTLFYLCLSVGGALGGAFNTFLAPVLFSSYAEYPLLLLIAAPFLFNASSKPALYAFLIAAALLVGNELQPDSVKFFKQYPYWIFAAFGLAYLAMAVFFVKNKTAALIVFAFCASSSFSANGWLFEELFAKRNFFGQIKIVKILLPNTIELQQGTTVHGRQQLDFKNEPLADPAAYYGKESPVEDFFNVFNKRRTPQNIALLGMGGGALLCYPKPSDTQSIFEIDPDIIKLSTEQKFFTYLDDCAPHAKIYEGDARMEMAKRPNGSYDLIVFDAFSSHFIPAHLVTKEAADTYLSKLKPNGLILFHISARLFDVEGILSKLAESTGNVFIVRTGGKSYGEKEAPRWGVLGKKDSPEIKELLKYPAWREARHAQDTPLWTDDFHNLWGILRNLEDY